MKTTTKIMYLFTLAFIVGSCSSDGENDDPQPQYNLDALQGKWYRVGGNNPDANGMEVTVTNDQGVLTDPANTSLQVNNIKWKDIEATGETNYEHGELGSDQNYYSGFMEMGSDDTLRISVNSPGAGNVQKWVRTFIAPIAELHECEPYEPDVFSMAKDDLWVEAGEEDEFPGLLPASTDPAGGYYIVTLESTGPLPSQPWIAVSVSGEEVPVINGTSAGTDTPLTRKVAFSAHPGIAYDVMARPFYNASPSWDVYPESYKISWEYVGIMDCYEPNDSFDEAKFIPKDEVIEAYANKNNEGYGIQEEQDDYYKVVLFQPARLQVQLLQSPSDDFIDLDVYRESGGEIVTTLTPISGMPGDKEDGALYLKTTKATLDAGTYYVRARTFMNGGKTADLNLEEPLPDTWTTPYTFTVTAVE